MFSEGEKMKPTRQFVSKRQRGFAIIISMIFVLVFSALAVSMAAISGVNGQIASNQQKADSARACAESGLEVLRYWLSRVSFSGTTPPAERFEHITSSLTGDLTENAITNIMTYPTTSQLYVPPVTLDSANGKSFRALISKIDDDTLQLHVTGTHGQFRRTIRVNYDYGQRAHSVFDFGVATKGPLSLSGNIELDGINVSIESSVYIESMDSALALSIIGNSQIAGDVKIANPIAAVDLQGGKAGIGGETGQDAIENHVEFGAAQTEFPEPVPSYFEPFATNIVDSNTDTSSDIVLENVRILAGTNPTFSGDATLRGIVFIEAPNVVKFTGSADVIGIIVGNGDIEDDSGVNRIEFQGNVSSTSVTELPDEEQFADIRDETGTFAMAPGFHLAFGGSFETINGAIAGNGIEFFGNAGGTIGGSIINYADEEMTLSGNSDLFFNRSGLTEVPAGFVPEVILAYNPASYSEINIFEY
jgi:type II secretory pathway pseudopilin PulG